ncbi:hypothetical protein HUJ05_007647, partial [Dendroctonus ponderosae]
MEKNVDSRLTVNGTLDRKYGSALKKPEVHFSKQNSFSRVAKITWSDRVRNADVLLRLNTTVEVLITVKRRKLEYFGHVIRGKKYRFLQLIIQEKIEGRRAPRQRWTSWLQKLGE